MPNIYNIQGGRGQEEYIDNLNHTLLFELIFDSQIGSWIEEVVPTLAFPTHWFVIGKMIIS